MTLPPGPAAGLPRPDLSATRLKPSLLQPPLRRQRDPDVSYVLAKGTGSTRRLARCPGRFGLDRLTAPLFHKPPSLLPSACPWGPGPLQAARHTFPRGSGGGGGAAAIPWKPGRGQNTMCFAANHPRKGSRPGGPAVILNSEGEGRPRGSWQPSGPQGPKWHSVPRHPQPSSRVAAATAPACPCVQSGAPASLPGRRRQLAPPGGRMVQLGDNGDSRANGASNEPLVPSLMHLRVIAGFSRQSRSSQ